MLPLCNVAEAGVGVVLPVSRLRTLRRRGLYLGRKLFIYDICDSCKRYGRGPQSQSTIIDDEKCRPVVCKCLWMKEVEGKKGECIIDRGRR